MQTLFLTSPHIKGPVVHHAQTLLTNNVFHQDFMRGGTVDDDCGPETCRAFIRAKYWLGYPQTVINNSNKGPIFGDVLEGYLSGRKKLPKGYRARREHRFELQKQEEASKPLGVKALERAAQDLGMKENPAGSNICPISTRWGMVGPWCNMAVSEWYLDVGSTAFKERVNYAYVPYFLHDAERGANGLSVVRSATVKPGYAVCFDWDDDGVADHIGLFREWITPGSTFKTIEGNTSAGSNSNGGQVQNRDRSISDVAVYGGLPAFVNISR